MKFYHRTGPLLPSGGYVWEEWYSSVGFRRKKPVPADCCNWSPFSFHGAYFLNDGEAGFFPMGSWGQDRTLVAEVRDGLYWKHRTAVADNAANLAVMMAQYRQTADTFHTMASSVIDMFRRLRRGRISGFTDEWLKWQYGYLPTLMDLEDTLEGLSDRLSEGISNRLQVTYQKERFANHGHVLGNIRCKGTAYLKLTVKSDIERESARWGLSNLLELGWEVIPASFVFDHLIPVGKYLADLDALGGVELCGHATYSYHEELNSPNGKGYEKWIWRDTLPERPPISYSPSTSVKALLNDVALLISVRDRGR